MKEIVNWNICGSRAIIFQNLFYKNIQIFFNIFEWSEFVHTYEILQLDKNGTNYIKMQSKHDH